LPANHTGAFQAEEYVADQAFYFHIGPMALQRQLPSKGAIAYFDPQGLQTATSPNSVTVLAFDNLTQPQRLGLRGSLGYYWQGEAFEMTGFGIFEGIKALTYNAPLANGVNVPFLNIPANFPFSNSTGFIGDSVRTSFRTNLADAEINYRYSSQAVVETELIMGIRYMNMRETVGIATAAGGIPANGALYQLNTEDNFVGGQLGFEMSKQLGQYFTLGLTCKTALGNTFVNLNTQVTRGDGLFGLDNTRGVNNFTQVYDVGAYVDFNLLEKLHLRAGYTGLWIVNTTLALDQFYFDLNNTNAKIKESSVFYHGPTVEFQFLF